MNLSEIYTSTQGEGPNTGRMTQFVRFAGCNMRCPGWPCDTQFAIEPSIWKKEAQLGLEPHQVFEQLDAWPKHICLTGGEPFVQRTEALQEFVEMAQRVGYSVECFSNGSFIYPGWARFIQIMMDWKLNGSGEADTNRAERVENAKWLHRKDGIKFVVASEDDLIEATILSGALLKDEVQAQLWVGAAWGKITDEEIIDYTKDHKMPWRLNVQQHKHVWDPELRGV